MGAQRAKGKWQREMQSVAVRGGGKVVNHEMPLIKFQLPERRPQSDHPGKAVPIRWMGSSHRMFKYIRFFFFFL